MKNVIEGYCYNRCVSVDVRPSACVLLVFVFQNPQTFFVDVSLQGVFIFIFYN